MSKIVKLNKGFDLKLAGKASQEMANFAPAQTFALKPTDFPGIQRPKVLVQEGDTVKAGTPILIDKAMDQVIYAAPVSGEIVEIKRGEKRKLLEIRILAEQTISHENLGKIDLNAEDLAAKLASSGVWPNIIQRPFGVVANPADKPKAIFISAPSRNRCFDQTYFRKGSSQCRRIQASTGSLFRSSECSGEQVFRASSCRKCRRANPSYRPDK